MPEKPTPELLFKEIEEFVNSDGWVEGYCQTALNSLCDRWRDENDKW